MEEVEVVSPGDPGYHGPTQITLNNGGHVVLARHPPG